MKRISKIILVVSLLFLTIGCGNIMDTPTKKVEQFLNKYQTLDKEVLEQLDTTMNDANSFNEEQKDKYHELMKKQYKNLEYKIKDEKVDGNTANVEVEIQVIDYGKAINEADMYLAANKDEFVSDKDKTVVDNEKYLDYKIKKMEKMKDQITYTINFDLTKVDGKWQLNDISDIELLKLHGLYY